MKGGPADKTESNEGYHELYMVTRIQLFRWYNSDLWAGRKHQTHSCLYSQQDQETDCTGNVGVASKVEDMQTASGIKDKMFSIGSNDSLQRHEKSSPNIWDALTKNLSQKLTNGTKINLEIRLTHCSSLMVRNWVLNVVPTDLIVQRPGLDPCQDTPIEILHTILLGIVKYAWHNMHTSWAQSAQDLLWYIYKVLISTDSAFPHPICIYDAV